MASADPVLTLLVPSLAAVPGVMGIALGGSRARGTANEASDYDVGLYYGPDDSLDTGRLLDVLRDVVDDPASASVTAVGAWGPRIVGGGWLSIKGRKVDLLYRGVGPVSAVIADCRAGRISMDYQPGHPHGFCSAVWMGEIALCRPLHDPRGVIAELKAAATPYPDKLREALLNAFLWEVLFSIENAEIAIPRGDPTQIAGCAYRALCCIRQVLFAVNRRFLINEKGALAEAAGFPLTLANIKSRSEFIWSALGQSNFAGAVAELKALDQELRAVVLANT